MFRTPLLLVLLCFLQSEPKLARGLELGQFGSKFGSDLLHKAAHGTLASATGAANMMRNAAGHVGPRVKGAIEQGASAAHNLIGTGLNALKLSLIHI